MRTRYLVVALIGAAVSAGLLAVYFKDWGSIQRLSENIVAVCEGEGDRAACYEREVPVLWPGLPIEKVFNVIRNVRALDPSYQFCHVLAHKIGERVVAEDPSEWIDAIPLNPTDGICSNGFIHGVTGGRFRAEVLDAESLKTLIPDFTRACLSRPEWQSSALDRAICSHGMGHLYMFISDADIPLSLSLCEETMPKDMRRVCREGVFMQIYQPLEPDDFLLIERMPVKPTKETVRQFCARYEQDEHEGACLRESWSFFREELQTGSGIAQFCSGQPNEREEVACHESSFALAGRQTLANPSKALAICADIPGIWKEMCYASTARSILEEDRRAGEKALNYCSSVPAPYDDACKFSLVSTAQFIFGDSSERKEFCELVPQDLRTRCIGRR